MLITQHKKVSDFVLPVTLLSLYITVFYMLKVPKSDIFRRYIHYNTISFLLLSFLHNIQSSSHSHSQFYLSYMVIITWENVSSTNNSLKPPPVPPIPTTLTLLFSLKHLVFPTRKQV